MEKQDVKVILSDAVEKSIDESGWANLISVGVALKEAGFDYKSKGYEKLVHLFKEHVDTFNVRYDKDTGAKFPPAFVRRKTFDEIKKHRYAKSRSLVSPKGALSNWALLAKYDHRNPELDPTVYKNEERNAIRELKAKVLGGERWYYGGKERDDCPILSTYLKYTFYRLTKEDEANKSGEPKKIREADGYAAFNTGLVDNRYRPIYALFTMNEAIKKYQLLDFCTSAEGNHTGKELVRNFKPLPSRAHYFDKPSEMLYDVTCGPPETNLKHIVKDNADRLPIQLLKENLPKGFEWKNTDDMFPEDRRLFFKQVGAAIFEDDRMCRRVESEIERAIDLAMKRVEWNFKTAIPMYFPTENIMSLLLPLSIIDDGVVDAALVVEKTKSGNYLGHTILTLEMAYSNARLVSRPDSDWLAVEKIGSAIENIEAEEDL